MAANRSKTYQTRRFTESIITERGITLTAQRRVIAETLFSRDQHVTAEQLHDQIRLAGHKVSKATVYNTLSLFSRRGLVRPITVEGSATFYDSNTSHHHHFFNVDSGQLVDMEGDPLPQYLKDSLPAGTSLETVDLVVRIKNSNL